MRKLLLHRDEKIQQLVRKNWGEVKGATTAEMRQEIDRLVKVVRAGPGEPYEGKKLFDMTCAKCHQLYSKGGDFGPNLTSYKRDDVDNMMLHIVNPSAEIREGYENYMVVTADGRSLNGFLLEKDEKIVVLRGAEGQTTVIRKDQIDEMSVLPAVADARGPAARHDRSAGAQFVRLSAQRPAAEREGLTSKMRWARSDRRWRFVDHLPKGNDNNSSLQQEVKRAIEQIDPEEFRKLALE